MSHAQPPASVFPLPALEVARLSARLRRALELVASCAPKDAPRLVVARPEIFTDGASLAWFHNEIGGVADHLCISDGSVVRLAAGLRNHVFFYALGDSGQMDALDRLERRASEVLAQMHSQVNTALRFRGKNGGVAPFTQAMVLSAPQVETAPVLRRLTLHRYSPRESVALTLASPPVEAVGPFDQLRYLRISESGLREPSLAQRLRGHIADTLSAPRRAVVWILPDDATQDRELRVGSIVNCLFAEGGRLPGGVLPNVFYTTDDISHGALGRIAAKRTLVCDDFAEIWRHSPAFYKCFGEIIVYARARRHAPPQLLDLFRAHCGPLARIEWLRPRDKWGNGEPS